MFFKKQQVTSNYSESFSIDPHMKEMAFSHKTNPDKAFREMLKKAVENSLAEQSIKDFYGKNTSRVFTHRNDKRDWFEFTISYDPRDNENLFKLNSFEILHRYSNILVKYKIEDAIKTSTYSVPALNTDSLPVKRLDESSSYWKAYADSSYYHYALEFIPTLWKNMYENISQEQEQNNEVNNFQK